MNQTIAPASAPITPAAGKRPSIARSTPPTTNDEHETDGEQRLQTHPALLLRLSVPLRRRRQRLSVDELDHRVDAGVDPAAEVAGAKARDDDV